MAIANSMVSSGIPGQIFEAPTQCAVTTMMFCNVGALNTNISVWMVPSGQALSNSMQILNAINMPAAETFSVDTERFILEQGDSVWVQAQDSNVVAATVSYIPTN
jgi:hypothetical protein